MNATAYSQTCCSGLAPAPELFPSGLRLPQPRPPGVYEQAFPFLDKLPLPQPTAARTKLYFAFRELGRVVRTIFLLRYLSSAELRQTIQAATNKARRFVRIVLVGATQGKLRSDPMVSLRSEPEMTASPLQTRPSKVGTPPNHDKLTDPVLEMRAQASVAWGGWRLSWT